MRIMGYASSVLHEILHADKGGIHSLFGVIARVIRQAILIMALSVRNIYAGGLAISSHRLVSPVQEVQHVSLPDEGHGLSAWVAASPLRHLLEKSQGFFVASGSVHGKPSLE